jgi:uncharacterized membrane protein YdbT with pleckstrin-like domain
LTRENVEIWEGTPMSGHEYMYDRKPAWIHTLVILVVCLFVVRFLLSFSDAIQDVVSRQILIPLDAPRDTPFWELPYGFILSMPFLLIALRRLLWNVMTRYKIAPGELRLITGILSRQHEVLELSRFHELTLKQSLLQAPLRCGTLTLTSRHGDFVALPGVCDVEAIAESMRPYLSKYQPARRGGQSSFPRAPQDYPDDDRTSSNRVASNERADSQKTVVVHKGGGCFGCLIFMLIIILLPAFLAVVFKVAIFAAIVEFFRNMFSR